MEKKKVLKRGFAIMTKEQHKAASSKGGKGKTKVFIPKKK